MKKLLLLVLSVVLISGCVAQEELVPADDVSDVPTSNVFGDWDDEGSGITFEFPLDWGVYSLGGDSGVLFHKDTEVLADWENEGSLVYKIIVNLDGVGLDEYLDGVYEECLAIADPEFGPVCVEMDIEGWDNSEISGYPAYLSERRGMPSSGETAKDLYVVADGFFINLKSVGTGIAMSNNGDFVESVFDRAIETMSIE
jgi:hypothetical protein